jgi:ankyrin repeat protein
MTSTLGNPLRRSIFILIAFFLKLNSCCVQEDDNSRQQIVHQLFESVRLDDARAVTEVLRENPHLLNIQGPGGQTPLMHGVLQGKFDVVRALLDAGADCTVGENDGYTPLHGAGFQGRAAIAQLLLDHGLDPLKFHQDGYAPIHRACWGREPRHAETVLVFLKAGVSPTLQAKSSSGMTPLEMVRNNPLTKQYLQEYIKRQQPSKDEDGSTERDEL